MEKLLNNTIQLINNLGKASSFLSLVMVLGTVAVVVLRYWLGIGATELQESVLYSFAALWWLSSPLTLAKNGHVRVDIFYQRWAHNFQCKIDILGHLLLSIPVCALIFFVSLDYVKTSWMLREISSEPGGLPIVYLLKSLLVVGPFLLGLQALLLALTLALTLRGKLDLSRLPRKMPAEQRSKCRI